MAAAAARPRSSREDYKNLTEASNKFALGLYEKLRSKNDANIVISPIGIHILLATVHQGAKGETAAEIASVLQQPDDDEKSHRDYKPMIKSMKNNCLRFDSKMFIEQTYQLYPDFRNMSKAYLSDVDATDFKTNSSRSRQEINDWASSSTENKINDMLPLDVNQAMLHRRSTDHDTLSTTLL